MAARPCRATVRRDRPIVFLEYLKGDRRRLAAWLLGHGYRIFLHRHDWLCLPHGSPIAVHGSREITDSSET